MKKIICFLFGHKYIDTKIGDHSIKQCINCGYIKPKKKSIKVKNKKFASFWANGRELYNA